MPQISTWNPLAILPVNQLRVDFPAVLRDYRAPGELPGHLLVIA